MNATTIKSKPKDPSYHQVKIKVKTQQIQTHEYVIPSNFATIPNNRVQSRIMRNAHNKKRFSLPPSIKEEEENNDDEDNIPLAILAYRKGFITPDKEKDVFPLVSLQKRKSNPITTYSNFHQFYQLSNYSSSSNSSQSSTEIVPKNQQNGTEPKFYRRYSSSK